MLTYDIEVACHHASATLLVAFPTMLNHTEIGT
jgi:hypothetical protein